MACSGTEDLGAKAVDQVAKRQCGRRSMLTFLEMLRGITMKKLDRLGKLSTGMESFGMAERKKTTQTIPHEG